MAPGPTRKNLNYNVDDDDDDGDDNITFIQSLYDYYNIQKETNERTSECSEHIRTNQPMHRNQLNGPPLQIKLPLL